MSSFEPDMNDVAIADSVDEVLGEIGCGSTTPREQTAEDESVTDEEKGVEASNNEASSIDPKHLGHNCTDTTDEDIIDKQPSSAVKRHQHEGKKDDDDEEKEAVKVVDDNDEENERAGSLNVDTRVPREYAEASRLPGAYAEGSRAPFHSSSGGQDISNVSYTASGSSSTSNHDSSLVEATPVDKADDLEEAQPVDRHCNHRGGGTGGKNQSDCTQRRTLGVVSVAVVVVLAVVVVPLLASLDVSTDENVETEALSPMLDSDNMTPDVYLNNVLSLRNLTLPPAMEGTSHQELAFDWMAQDPNLKDYKEDRVIQRYALATLFYATNGAQWTHKDNWLSYEHHECEWYGGDKFMAWYDIEFSDYPCNNATGLYERLWLSDNNLNGTLPNEVYSLWSLLSLEMFGNMNLSGTLSSKIGQLRKLEKLGLVMSNMLGMVPSEIGLLSNMKIFYLSKGGYPLDKFNGSIPSEFLQLTSLEQVTFNFNDFTGTLPSGFERMTNLTSMGFTDCKHTGCLPSEWGQMTQLRFLYLTGNQLTGAIPTELGLLGNLNGFMLSNNRLSGTIPTELGSAKAIKEVLVANNTLSGTVPSELGLLTDTVILYLSHNAKLTGTLPSELAQLTKVAAFDISETAITGDVPLFLQEAQNQTSFEKYMGVCRRRLSCQVDGDNDS